MPKVKLTIFGEPMGKQRPKFSRIGGYVKTYTPKDTLNYESVVAHEYREKYDGMLFTATDQLVVKIKAFFQIPKGHYKFYKKLNKVCLDKNGAFMKAGAIRPTKKPDIDNIAKICLDGLNKIAFVDDSQIVSLIVEKWYCETPRVEIEIDTYIDTIIGEHDENYY